MSSARKREPKQRTRWVSGCARSTARPSNIGSAPDGTSYLFAGPVRAEVRDATSNQPAITKETDYADPLDHPRNSRRRPRLLPCEAGRRWKGGNGSSLKQAAHNQAVGSH